MFSSSKGGVKANVVDSTLVVTFLSSREPRVWRIDMAQFISAALEIRESQGRFALVLKPGAGPAEEIGFFPDKKKAVEALESVTEAFLRGRGDVQLPVKSGGGFFKKLFKFIFLLLIVVAGVVIWGKAHRPVNQNDVVSAPAESGVPVPADEVLGQ